MLSGAECTTAFKFSQSGNLQRCARLSSLYRISLCAPEPRNNALHCVCCVETINMSLSRHTTNKMFFFSRKLNLQSKHKRRKASVFAKQKQTAYVHRRALCRYTYAQNSAPLCTSYQIARCAQSGRFARLIPKRKVISMQNDYSTTFTDCIITSCPIRNNPFEFSIVFAVWASISTVKVVLLGLTLPSAKLPPLSFLLFVGNLCHW